MKRTVFLIGFVCLGLALFACSHVKAPPGAKNEKMIWSNYENPPDWAYTKGKRESGYIYATGISSDYVATEQVARKEAIDESIEKLTMMIATKAERKIQKAAYSFGLSSDKLDPSIAKREFVTLLSRNLVTNLEIKDWYLQKWSGPKGITWKAYVYARVPERVANEALKTLAEEKLNKSMTAVKDTESAKKQIEDVNKFWEKMKSEELFE